MIKVPLKWRLYSLFYKWFGLLAMQGRPKRAKVFCVGLNKTGTTSWTQAMTDLGYLAGNERAGEIFFDDWVKKDYSRTLKFCQSAEFFQDVPFSLPGVYRILHQKFPDSKFILTVRDSAEQWYESVTKFHSKTWSPAGNCPPTDKDLKQAVYIYQGWPARFCKEVFLTSRKDPYNKEILLKFYEEYIRSISEYFRDYPDAFLIINVAEPDALKKMCDFLDTPYRGGEFPWKNRTQI